MDKTEKQGVGLERMINIYPGVRYPGWKPYMILIWVKGADVMDNSDQL